MTDNNTAQDTRFESVDSPVIAIDTDSNHKGRVRTLHFPAPYRPIAAQPVVPNPRHPPPAFYPKSKFPPVAYHGWQLIFACVDSTEVVQGNGAAFDEPDLKQRWEERNKNKAGLTDSGRNKEPLRESLLESIDADDLNDCWNDYKTGIVGKNTITIALTFYAFGCMTGQSKWQSLRSFKGKQLPNQITDHVINFAMNFMAKADLAGLAKTDTVFSHYVNVALKNFRTDSFRAMTKEFNARRMNVMHGEAALAELTGSHDSDREPLELYPTDKQRIEAENALLSKSAQYPPAGKRKTLLELQRVAMNEAIRAVDNDKHRRILWAARDGEHGRYLSDFELGQQEGLSERQVRKIRDKFRKTLRGSHPELFDLYEKP